MSQIKQLLHLHRQGKKIKEIARMLALSKNTVKSYLRKVASSGVNPDTLLELDDPVLEARFHTGNPAYLDTRFIDFKDRVEGFEKELMKDGARFGGMPTADSRLLRPQEKLPVTGDFRSGYSELETGGNS